MSSGGNKTKTRVGVRLKEAIVGTSKSTNRSADLVALTDHYNTLKNRLKLLIVALKNQHASMVQLNKTRMEVANQIANLSNRSPIFDFAGLMPSPETPRDSVCSYVSIHASMNQRGKMYADKYAKFVVDYTVEWEKIVTSRINVALKQAESLRRDLDHYQKKVEALRQSTNSTMAKGKIVDPKTAEKLSRNEDKLLNARREYEKFASDLCLLMEEVTERSWKDLHPLLIKLSQFDATLSADENKLFANLNLVTENLKKVATAHGLKPQARLKDLESLQPEFLSTKAAENSLEAQQRGAIAGENPLSPASSTASAGSLGLSPQSAGETSRGGSGVGEALVSRTSSFTSVGEGPPSHAGVPQRAASFHSTGSGHVTSTTDMMAIAAASAPPPTMEMVNDSGHRPPRDRTQSTSSLPPLPPSSSAGAVARQNSYQEQGYGSGAQDLSFGYDSDSNLSSHSLPMAPAPAAPPPPPPAPPALSMYSSYADEVVPVADAVGPPQSIGYSNYQATPAPAPAHPWSTGGATAPDVPVVTPQMSGRRGSSTNPFEGGGGSTNPFEGSFGGSVPPPGGGRAGHTNPFDE